MEKEFNTISIYIYYIICDILFVNIYVLLYIRVIHKTYQTPSLKNIYLVVVLIISLFLFYTPYIYTVSKGSRALTPSNHCVIESIRRADVHINMQRTLSKYDLYFDCYRYMGWAEFPNVQYIEIVFDKATGKPRIEEGLLHEENIEAWLDKVRSEIHELRSSNLS